MQVLGVDSLLASFAATSVFRLGLVAMGLQRRQSATVALGATLAGPIWQNLVMDQHLHNVNVRGLQEFRHDATPVSLFSSNPPGWNSTISSDIRHLFPRLRLQAGWALVLQLHSRHRASPRGPSGAPSGRCRPSPPGVCGGVGAGLGVPAPPVAKLCSAALPSRTLASPPLGCCWWRHSTLPMPGCPSR